MTAPELIAAHMEANGFKLKKNLVGEPLWINPTGGIGTRYFPQQARYLTLQDRKARRVELDKLSGDAHGGGNWRRLIVSRCAQLDKEIEVLEGE